MVSKLSWIELFAINKISTENCVFVCSKSVLCSGVCEVSVGIGVQFSNFVF